MVRFNPHFALIGNSQYGGGQLALNKKITILKLLVLELILLNFLSTLGIMFIRKRNLDNGISVVKLVVLNVD